MRSLLVLAGLLACLFLHQTRHPLGAPTHDCPSDEPPQAALSRHRPVLCATGPSPRPRDNPAPTVSTSQAQGKPYRALQVRRPLDPVFERYVPAHLTAVPRGDPSAMHFLLCAGSCSALLPPTRPSRPAIHVIAGRRGTSAQTPLMPPQDSRLCVDRAQNGAAGAWLT